MFIVVPSATMVIHCCIWFEQKSQLGYDMQQWVIAEDHFI